MNKRLEELVKNSTQDEQILKNVETLAKQAVLTGRNVYSLIQDRDVEKMRYITYEDLARYAKGVYEMWYNQITDPKHAKDYVTDVHDEQGVLEFAEKLKQDPSRNPKNMTEQQAFEFCFLDKHQMKGFEDLENARISFQMTAVPKDFDYQKDKDQYNIDFLHCRPFRSNQATEKNKMRRFYFDVKLDNIIDLSLEFLKHAQNDDQKLYFKFWTDNTRNDPFLIYATDSQVDWVLDTVEKIRKDKPELLESGNNDIKFGLKVADGVYFADEHTYKHTSFNSEMAVAVEDYKQDTDISKQVVQQVFSGGLENEKAFRGYMIEKLKQEHLEKLLEFIDEPDEFCKSDDPEIFENRKIFMQQLLDEFMDGKDDPQSEYNQRFERTVDLHIKLIKEGARDIETKIIVPAQVPYIYERDKMWYEQSSKQTLAERGYRNISFYYGVNPVKEFDQMFDTKKEFEERINIKDIVPFMEKHHISTTKPYLSVETEKELAPKTTMAQTL